MQTITTIGLDIAKSVFQVHGVDVGGQVIVRRQLKRRYVLTFFQKLLRVLKPGGRFAVSDVVTRGQVPEQLRHDMLLWVGCIAGALEEAEYRSKLKAAGFDGVSIEPTRIYRIADAREFLAGKGIDVDAIAQEVDGKFMSAFIRAVKPSSSLSRCGPTC